MSEYPPQLTAIVGVDPIATPTIKSPISVITPVVDFPEVGSEVVGFRLKQLLGRGAFGCVYLAEQEDLAHRLVVLKITTRPTMEPDRLARLQHTNIVPIYSVHRVQTLQAICMPYLGSLTLHDILKPIRQQHAMPTSASTVFSVEQNLKTRRSSSFPTPEFNQPTKSFDDQIHDMGISQPVREKLAQMSYVEAVFWITARLAEGLHHAHERGILHQDLKPANILFNEDGQPMLLDFNLAVDLRGHSPHAVGGTFLYMSPEQLEAIQNQERHFDVRNDLYALGVILFEMLTGQLPYPLRTGSGTIHMIQEAIQDRRKKPLSVRSLNPSVTPAMESIVHHLLAPNQKDRYGNAKELLIDIERQLNNLPLQFAPEASLQERASKWVRRNPKTIRHGVFAGLLVLAGSVGVVAYRNWSDSQEASALLVYQQFKNNQSTMEVDLLAREDHASRQVGLQQFEKQLRNLGLPQFGQGPPSKTWKHIPTSERSAFHQDVNESLLLYTHGLLEQARYIKDPHVLKQAQQCLVLASENYWQQRPLIWNKLQQNLDQLNGLASKEEPIQLDVASAQKIDLFLFAADAIAEGQFQRALSYLEELAQREPNRFAVQFGIAYCSQQLGDQLRALERYQIARALYPQDARPSFLRGVIYLERQQWDNAIREFTEAIRRNPDLGAAYKNRGLVYRRQEKWDLAEKDFTQALDLGFSPIQIHLLRASIYDRLNNSKAAQADREVAKQLEPSKEEDYLVRASSKLPKDPQGALADYQAAEKLNPRSLAALQNQAHVLSEHLKQPEKALEILNRTVQIHPQFPLAGTGRAVLLARMNKRSEAHQEAQRVQLLSTDPGIMYRLVGVYALTSDKHPEDRQRALKLLQQAFSDGFRQFSLMDRDEDITNLKPLPEFQDLVRSAKRLTPNRPNTK